MFTCTHRSFVLFLMLFGVVILYAGYSAGLHGTRTVALARVAAEAKQHVLPAGGGHPGSPKAELARVLSQVEAGLAQLNYSISGTLALTYTMLLCVTGQCLVWFCLFRKAPESEPDHWQLTGRQRYLLLAGGRALSLASGAVTVGGLAWAITNLLA